MRIPTIRRIEASMCGMPIPLQSKTIILRKDCIHKLKGQVTHVGCKVDGRLCSLLITDPLITEVLEWWENRFER